jgi:hypothetical protein
MSSRMESSSNSYNTPSLRELGQTSGVMNQKSAKTQRLVRIVDRDVSNDIFYVGFCGA